MIPYDANETFGGGRGMGPGPGGPPRGGFRPDRDGAPLPPGPGRGPGAGRGGVSLDPLVGLDDPTKPLRSKLL
ncbi:MAG TPA: hypothetical protein VH679_13130, partial [Vicinamibacterales bacterium]